MRKDRACITILLLILSFVAGASITNSEGSTTIMLMDDVNIPEDGSNWSLLTINNVSNLGSFSVYLSWDPSVVNVTSVGDSDFIIFNYTNYDTGFVNIAGYSMDSVSGTFDIARLEFEAIGSAGDSCDLEIIYSQLLTAEPFPVEIVHIRMDGRALIFGNSQPHKPTLVSPSDGSIVSSKTSATLKVQVIDPDEDSMNVCFYDAFDDSLIDIDNNVSNGSTASVMWVDLSPNTEYGWYAVASDSELENTSDTWVFTTREPDIEIELEIKGGIGISVYITNTGDDDATDVEWSISVKSRGLLDIVDESSDGTVYWLAAGGEIVVKEQKVFGFGKVEIKAIVEIAGVPSFTETADGFLVGLWMILR